MLVLRRLLSHSNDAIKRIKKSKTRIEVSCVSLTQIVDKPVMSIVEYQFSNRSAFLKNIYSPLILKKFVFF